MRRELALKFPGLCSESGTIMFVKTPRWLLVLEAALLLGAVIVLAYKALMWIQPLSGLEQTPHARKIDPQTQILTYYRQYPDRYIRISKETWQYEELSHIAMHSFTLKNTATVPYQDIEIRFNYESSGGKVLYTKTVKIQGALAALGTMKCEKIKVQNVPMAATNVVLSVAGARMP